MFSYYELRKCLSCSSSYTPQDPHQNHWTQKAKMISDHQRYHYAAIRPTLTNCRKDRSAILLRQWKTVTLFFLTLVSFQLFTRLHLCSIHAIEVQMVQGYHVVGCNDHIQQNVNLYNCANFTWRGQTFGMTLKEWPRLNFWPWSLSEQNRRFKLGFAHFCPFWWFCPFCWPHLGQFPAKVKQAVDRICE